MTMVPAKMALFDAKGPLIQHPSYYWSIIQLVDCR